TAPIVPMNGNARSPNIPVPWNCEPRCVSSTDSWPVCLSSRTNEPTRRPGSCTAPASGNDCRKSSEPPGALWNLKFLYGSTRGERFENLAVSSELPSPNGLACPCASKPSGPPEPTAVNSPDSPTETWNGTDVPSEETSVAVPWLL